MQVWVYTLISVSLVSLLSLVGIFTLFSKRKNMQEFVLDLVSVATGTLLASAFIHLIPESYEHLPGSRLVPLLILGGMLFFFSMEKFIHWRHCHGDPSCKVHRQHLAPINIIGDSIHNFIDGMVIASSFIVGIPTGIAATIAIMFHEIPQELGDFGILVYSGYSNTKALLMNFLSALTAIAGALLTLLIGVHVQHLAFFLLPVAAGGFIYIAGTDLMPELHNEMQGSRSVRQLLLMLLGMAIIGGLSLFRSH